MLPAALYEALPGLYAAAGLVSLAAADNRVGVASAMLLICAAAEIAWLRWTYRSGRRG